MTKPATGRVTGTVGLASAAEVDDVVRLARGAFPAWRDTSIARRTEVLFASLFGDLHAHGADGVRFFTRGKVVTTRWPDPATGGVDLGFPTHR